MASLQFDNQGSNLMDVKDTNSAANNTSTSITLNNQRSSWQDLRRSVRTSRKLHAQFANKIPHNFTFVPRSNGEGESISGNESRVLFLGVLQGQRENTLLYIDVPTMHSPEFLDKPVEWKSALTYFQASSHSEKYSKEEELLRERKRLSVHGITSYQVSTDNSRVLFPAAGSLFVVDLDQIGRFDGVEPTEILSQCKGSRMDPKMSPENPKVVAFIHENDIWVTHTESHMEKRLTYSHKACKNSIDDTFSSGIASYIVQEEFDRYTGYWWQPNNPPDKHRILYELVDESDVEVLHITNPLAQPGIDSYRYPKAGTPNAKVSLRLLDFSTTKDGQICDVVTWKLSESLHDMFPWMEYIVRIDWLPSGKGIWAQLLDRLQQKSIIVYIPLSQFDRVVPSNTPDDTISCRNGNDVEMSAVDDCGSSSTLHSSSISQNSVKILYEETSSVWINVHDTFYFFQNNPIDEVNFIWASEQTGHRHLYLINCYLKRANCSKRLSTGDLVAGESKYCLNTVTPLTSGDWEVLEQTDSLWVDESNQQMYFMALKDTPLESHLYQASYANPGSTVRLTHSCSSHNVAMSKNCQQFITVSSSINELYTVKVYNLSPRPIAVVNMMEPSISPEYVPPELFSFTNSSGDLIHGIYYKPRDIIPEKKYPTVLFVYGGPHVQLVSNSFKGLRYQRLYTLSSLGYVVIAIDGRGSTHRGLQFEGHLKHKMGQIEINDQVEGILSLAKKVDFIDLDRVAIHGWSYGGYLSLMGLAQRPDIFKVAVAGAPVVCWEHYDTGYTERYMGTPQSNPDGYFDGSVLNCLNKFPNEPNRLLIVHGLIDENVHFVHTAHLVNAFVKHCKPYQLQIYPGERHGIRSPDSNEHFEVVVISFLQQYL
ncbi:dipeptidyl peptidase 9-like [Clavelina lepadiformis]|uniref:Dipeptidyl peptidase 9 n=1 Tax=Clavelina lepadiformis TaxID=159417 RepID=A0ABP0GT71_CLALP